MIKGLRLIYFTSCL
uniref:Uncharacterized protein n=1 Tax=Anguilla anguilla TaxID=7936 RepID=A0A0E9QXX4_ANGAN